CELYSTTDSIAMDFLTVQLHFTIGLIFFVAFVLLIAGCGGDAKKAVYPSDGDISVIIPKAPGGGRHRCFCPWIVAIYAKRASRKSFCSCKQT
ncbi:MAG: hypothetical protein LUF25_03460, partial [Phascolarctobacterium sp.]|nr:hypothetical protein [Phascolarctobacterium sp.]